MVKVKFSQNYWAKRKRIQRLPKFMTKIADTTSKKDAIGLIRVFREGIKKNSFRLKTLHPQTVENKNEKGLSRPRTPLYALGDEEENSYINMLRIRRLKRGYRVAPSRAKHHESQLKLKDLFVVHEFGTVINVTPKMRAYLHYIGIHLKAGTNVIRIPPRPAFFYAFRRYMAQKKKMDIAPEVKKAMANYVMTGKENLLKKITERSGDFDDYNEI